MSDSLLFWLAVALTASISAAIPAARFRARALLITVGSLLVLASTGVLAWSQLVLLVATVSWIVAMLGVASRRRWSHQALTLVVTLAPPIALWVTGKTAVAAASPGLVILYYLGVSYVVIKAFTLAKDLQDGQVARFDPLVGYAYFLHFPCYSAGPMHYYGEFQETLADPLRLTGERVLALVSRILLGMVKVKILAPLLMPASLAAITPGSAPSLGFLVGASFVYSLVLWLDFSGYCDVAIAVSGLMGVHVPENFNWPYLARNVRDFWQRWHITFTRVLTSYVFVPLVRQLRGRFGDRWPVVMVTGYLVTFVLCGYWHGPTANFLLWGAYHGAGMLAFDYYRRAFPPKRGNPRGRRWPAHAVAVAVTFTFVSLGWLLFAIPLSVLFTRFAAR